jgi:hypothetical protein
LYVTAVPTSRRDEEIDLSTTYQLQPRARLGLVPFVVAILVALSVGATGGSLVTRAVTDRPHPAAVASGWDAQKLSAMEGRQLAASARTGIRPWDRQKLAAMAGREKAEAILLRQGSGPVR